MFCTKREKRSFRHLVKDRDSSSRRITVAAEFFQARAEGGGCIARDIRTAAEHAQPLDCGADLIKRAGFDDFHRHAQCLEFGNGAGRRPAVPGQRMRGPEPKYLFQVEPERVADSWE